MSRFLVVSNISTVTRTCLTLLLVGFGHPEVFARDAYDREFKQLAADRERALAAAAEPINRRYVEAMTKLLRRATQNNDLEAALKIKEAIIAIGEDPTGDGLAGPVGKWAWTADRVLSIQRDGSFLVESGEGKGSGGTWRWTKRSKGEFTMIWAHGDFKDTLILSSDMNQISGSNNHGDKVNVRRVE